MSGVRFGWTLVGVLLGSTIVANIVMVSLALKNPSIRVRDEAVAPTQSSALHTPNKER
jgi:hypothetical protein